MGVVGRLLFVNEEAKGKKMRAVQKVCPGNQCELTIMIFATNSFGERIYYYSLEFRQSLVFFFEHI